MGFGWSGVLDRYDRFTQPGFETAVAKFSSWIQNFSSFVPLSEERPYYYWMLDKARDAKTSDPQEVLRLYAAIAFWKLYSTSPRVPLALMTDRQLSATNGRCLVELIRELPGTLDRSADAVMRLVKAIGDHQIHGMKSTGALPMRTTFLHCFFPEVIPIYDQMVLRAVGLSKVEARRLIHDPATLRQYLPHCWSLADRYTPKMPRGVQETPVRLVDIALWLSRGN